MRWLLPVLMMTLIPLLNGEDSDSSAMPTILTKSPFLPPDFQPPGTPGRATNDPKGKQQYEFRGVYELGGQFHYNLFKPSEQKGKWFTEKTAGDLGISIVEFDPEKDSLELVVNGEPMTLTLVETSNKPMALALAKPRQQATAKPPGPQKKARRRVIRPTSRKQRQSTVTTRRRTVSRTPSKP